MVDPIFSHKLQSVTPSEHHLQSVPSRTSSVKSHFTQSFVVAVPGTLFFKYELALQVLQVVLVQVAQVPYAGSQGTQAPVRLEGVPPIIYDVVLFEH